jgi:branched-chain amino acid transport system substrate-binding protein
MRHRTKTLLFIGIFSCFTGTAVAEQVVKIGYAGPLTGSIAHLGKDAENGARLAVDEANAEGISLNGQKVRFVLVSADDAADPKTAVSVAQQLADDGVVGVVGDLTSGATLPASRVYASAGIPEISPSATNVTYTRQGMPTAFRVIGDDAFVGRALADYMSGTAHYKRVAIIDDRSAYGAGLADTVAASLTAKGVTVVDRQYVTDHTVDFKGVLTAIKGRTPDAIFYGGTDAQAGPLRKQMTGLSLDIPLVGSAIETENFVKLAGDTANGTVSAESGQPIQSMAKGKWFIDKFKKYGDVDIYAPYAFDATWALINAMKAADSPIPSKYIGDLKSVDFKGVTGDISFDSHGDLRTAKVTLYLASNGKFVPFSTVDAK